MYGYYNFKTIDPILLEKLTSLINKAKQARSILQNNYIPEIVHSITWKNLKQSEKSKDVRKKNHFSNNLHHLFII